MWQYNALACPTIFLVCRNVSQGHSTHSGWSSHGWTSFHLPRVRACTVCVSTNARSTSIVIATHYWCMLSGLREIFHTCTHLEDFARVALAIMATSDQQLLNLGAHNKPNQPQQFDFPKCEFGKTRVCRKSVSVSVVWEVAMATLWLLPGSGLLSYLCNRFQDRETETFSRQCQRFSSGFSNWKEATVAFESHEKSATHKRAVDGVITLPQTTRDVGDLLSSAMLQRYLKPTVPHYHRWKHTFSC